MALQREKPIDERQRELEEEAEAYASRGIVSPGAIKAARWFSRILWLAMSALVVVMIYQLNTRAPQGDYDKLQRDAAELQRERKRAQDELDELKMEVLRRAAELGLAGQEAVGDLTVMSLVRAVADEARRAQSREEADALVMLELVRFKAEEEMKAGVEAEDYAKASPPRKAVALWRMGQDFKQDSVADTMRALALARDAALVERIIAIRSLGANRRGEEATRKVLSRLLADARPLVAAEAKKALG